MTESDDGDLSPDTTKPTKKKKKQINISDALSQPKIKATKIPTKKLLLQGYLPLTLNHNQKGVRNNLKATIPALRLKVLR